MPTAVLIETRFVRADRLCLGDVIADEGSKRRTTVIALHLIGDDVVVNEGAITTSIGNVLRVRRTVERTEPSRYQPPSPVV